MPPLTIAQGGTQEHFTLGSFKQGMEVSNSFRAGGNLFWLDFQAQAGAADSRIPLSPKQIGALEQHYFLTPRAIHKEVVVPLKAGVDPLTQKGWFGGSNDSPRVVISACF